MKDSEILLSAMNRIEAGVSNYICFAIDDAAHLTGDNAVIERGKKLQRWIMSMLPESTTLYGWMAAVYPKLYSRFNYRHVESWRSYRVQWLLHLIAICEAEES